MYSLKSNHALFIQAILHRKWKAICIVLITENIVAHGYKIWNIKCWKKMTEAYNYMVHNLHTGIRKKDRIELCYFTNDGMFDKYFIWRECNFRTYVTPLFVCTSYGQSKYEEIKSAVRWICASQSNHGYGVYHFLILIYSTFHPGPES